MLVFAPYISPCCKGGSDERGVSLVRLPHYLFRFRQVFCHNPVIQKDYLLEKFIQYEFQHFFGNIRIFQNLFFVLLRSSCRCCSHPRKSMSVRSVVVPYLCKPMCARVR